MNIKHASFIRLPVTDQERALAFYTDVLGFEVRADRQVGPTRWLQVAPEGAETVFTLSAPAWGISRPAPPGGSCWSRPTSTPTARSSPRPEPR
ncbi:VOC family protein [Streptomyces sp. NPDC054840]